MDYVDDSRLFLGLGAFSSGGCPWPSRIQVWQKLGWLSLCGLSFFWKNSGSNQRFDAQILGVKHSFKHLWREPFFPSVDFFSSLHYLSHYWEFNRSSLMASHLRCWRIGGATSFPCGLYGLYGLCCVNTWPLHIFLSGSCNACRFYMKKTSQSPPSRFGFKLFAMPSYHVPKHAVLRVRRWCFRGRFCRRIRGLFRLLRICLRESEAERYVGLALSENLRQFIL